MIQEVHDVGVQYDSVTVVYMFAVCLPVTLNIIHVDVKHVSLSSCVYNSPHNFHTACGHICCLTFYGYIMSSYFMQTKVHTQSKHSVVFCILFL